MAYVTYIIGNGLDLSLGLKTSYRDFYDHVHMYGLHRDNRIYKAIEQSPETWADFELALGEHTSYIDTLPEKDKKRESVKFHDELEELRDDLAEYLEKQEHRIGNSTSRTTLTPEGYLSGLPVGQKNRVAPQEKTAFQFITLNYTQSLEAILKNSTQLLSKYGINFSAPHHIHGDLLENLTLGVSDDTQLSASMSSAEKDDLIKPVLIRSMNDGRIDALQEMIRRSSVVVLFGTSIGETDKYIWQMVMEWLSLSGTRHVVVHKHDSAYSDSVKRSSRKQKQFSSSVQEKLLRFSDKDGDAIASLRNRILVVYNTKELFVEA